MGEEITAPLMLVLPSRRGPNTTLHAMAQVVEHVRNDFAERAERWKADCDRAQADGDQLKQAFWHGMVMSWSGAAETVDQALCERFDLIGQTETWTPPSRDEAITTARRIGKDVNRPDFPGHLAPALTGLAVSATVGVRVSGPAEPIREKLRRTISALGATDLTAGEYGIVTDVRVADPGTLATQLHSMRGVPGVHALSVVHHTVLRDGPLPGNLDLEQMGRPLDDLDGVILRALQRDGRLPYTSLGSLIGMSQAGTRTRVVRLLRCRAIVVCAVLSPAARPSDVRSGFAGVVTGASVSSVARTSDRFSGQLTHLSMGSGRWDIVGQLTCPDLTNQSALHDRIRDLDHIADLTTWQVTSPPDDREAQPQGDGL